MTDTLRLLYAEDNPQDADLTQAHFARAAPDFRLDVVDSGARCLERLAAGSYDLLLLDNRLPDMDGLDLLARLRAEGQRLPVVMVTGVGDDETVARALRAGAADYVPKAGDYLDALPEILRGLLARERSRRPLDAAGARQVRRILHVEPNPMDVELTREHFAASAPHLALQAVSDAHQALALLAQAHEFELVLTDLRLPGMNALEFIREARHRGIELPFIVITGRGDENTAVAILRLGAYDYIVKRENYLTQLPHAIDHALERFGLDQTARQLHAELATLNASLEQKVAARTADLRDSEARFRAIIEASPVAMAVSDAQQNITFLNPKFVETFGYTLAEIPNLAAWWPLAYPDPDIRRRVAQAWQAGIDKAHRDGTEREPVEHAVTCKDGTLRNIRFSMAPMGTSNLVILYDLTERKRTEEALSESRARLEALTRRLLEVQETERRFIARELHDEVGGVLTAVKLNLQALRRAHTAEQGEAALVDGLALVDGAIRSVRSLSLDLRPAVLDDLGLIPALKWYCERQAQRAGVAIELALDAIDLKVAPQLESACFRIVQEAVTNVLRHAGAQRIQVSLRREDGSFSIEIADDGGGFDVAAAHRRGLVGETGGLLGMEERAGLLGGRLSIDSTAGAGTRVRAEFVLPEGGFA